MICVLLTTVMVLSFAACGSQGNSTAASAESTVTSESQTTESSTEASTAESSATEASAETTTETANDASADAAGGTSYADNFAVPTEDAVAFAEKIQAAVADEDPEALADLANYPIYVALGDGSVIESKEDLIALGADKIFTREMKDSIANADLSDLSASMLS